MKLDKVRVPKKDFNQSKNLVFASYLFVLSSTLLAWNEVFRGRLGGFSVPSLLAILAFGFMWVHYLTAYLKTNYEPTLDTKKSLKITQAFVLLAIFAHPVAIISKLHQAGYGIPPTSFKNYVGPIGALFISLGTISFLIFLTFEFKDQLKKKPKIWENVLRLNDVAMLLIILHGFRLGFVINSGVWFRYVWLGYGLGLLYFYYDKYINKQQVKKYQEAFMVGMVVIMMTFLGLATSGDTRIRNTPSNSNSSSKKAKSEQHKEGDSVPTEELAKNNGLDGKKCWIAVDGDVYDATYNSQWKNGEHTPSRGKAKCGEDLTAIIAQSPHGKSVLAELPIVGKLKIEEVQ